MAPQKPNTNKNDEQVEQTVQVDVEKEMLKSQVDELKNMVQMMAEQMKTITQSTQVSSEQKTAKDEPESKLQKSGKYYDIEEELDISPQARVKIMSLTVGGLNLRALHHIVGIPEFGQSVSVSFEDLRHIVNNHSDLAREGAFIIINEKAVKALYLDRDYEKLLGRNDIEAIVDLRPDQIYEALKTCTKAQLQAIVHQFIQGIVSGNSRYLDQNKIRIVSDFVGTDIYQLAIELNK